MDKGLTFYLNGKHVYCQFYADDGRMQTPAGLKVDKDKYKAGKLSKAENAHLTRLQTVVNHYEAQKLLGGMPTVASEVKSLVLDALNKDPKHKAKDSFLTLYARYVDAARIGDVSHAKGQYSPAWIRTADSVYNAIKGLPEAQKPAHTITAQDIGRIDTALTSRIACKGKNTKATKNTVATYIAVVCGILKKTRKLEWHNGPVLDLEGKKTGMEDVDYGVYNSLEELDLFEALDIDEELRDLYILGCWIGTRCEDLLSLQPRNRKGDLVNIHTKKTSTPVWVPLSTKAKEIWDKYSGNFCKTNKKDFLAFAKDMGKQAGLDTLTLMVRTEGGKKIERWRPFYELMGTHTMRRSYATNAYLAGLDLRSIMKVTGHKTERAFMRYIRLSSEQDARHAQKHPFYR